MEPVLMLRTDRVHYCQVTPQGLVDVDGPVEGGLVIGLRCLSQTTFFELVGATRIRAAKLCKDEGIDPDEVIEAADDGSEVKAIDKFERPLQLLGAAKRGVAEVHGLDLAAPAQVLERVPPSLAVEVGSKVLGMTTLANVPFAGGGSTR